MSEPLWTQEFDESYAVPDCIAMAEGLVDTSWHNNVCPSFQVECSTDANGVTLIHDLIIWADHPDPDQREIPSNSRFLIQMSADGMGFWQDGDGPFGYEGELFATDDETLVIPEYLRLLKEYRAWLKARA